MANKETCVTKRDCDVRHAAIMDELKEVREDIKNISVSIAELPERLWEKGDQRYAPKWTADALKVFMSAVGLAVIGAGLKLILI